MLGSPLLGTAVGLVLLFATTALLCSGITEWLSNVLQMRAKYLLTGMRAMLDGPEGGGAGAPNVLGRWWAYLQAGVDAMVGRPAAATAGHAGTVAAPPTDWASAAAAAPATGRNGRVAAARWAMRQTKHAMAVQAVRQNKPVMNVHDRVKEPRSTAAAVTKVRALTARSKRPPEPLLTTALWDSPLLRSLQSRRISGVGAVRNPQYVSGKTFARALVDLLVPADPEGPVPAAAELGKLRDAVLKLPEELPLRRQLLVFLARATTTVDDFERAVEQWYDEQMAKMAGWYKRWARVILGVVGFVVAVAINVDTVQVGHALYVDAPLQQAVVATADAGTLCQGEPDPEKRQACVDRKLDELRAAGIPFGYSAGCHWFTGEWRACWAWRDDAPPSGWDPWRKLLGWLVTAFAVSFGAPFWFEALSRLGSLRNAGTKPSSSTSPS